MEDDDLVLWTTFGLTHWPTVEQYPVMPCETHVLKFTPNDFCVRNPAIDVARANNGFNRSVAANAAEIPPSHGVQGSLELEEAAAAKASGCCK